MLTFGTAAATAVPTVATTSQITVGSGPWGMAVSHDGTRAYVANNNAGTLSVIDLTNNTVVATVNVGSGPFGVAVTPDGSEVWVTRPGSGRIEVVSTASNTVTAEVGVFNNPLYVLFNAAGTSAWVSNNGVNQVLELDQATGSVLNTISTGVGPEGLALSPDGSKLYIANSDGQITVANAGTSSAVTYPGIASWATQLAVSKDGRYVFVTDNSGTGDIYVFDTVTHTRSNTITVAANTEPSSGVVVSNDGKAVYVATGPSGTPYIAEIDVATQTVVGQIPCSIGPTVIAKHPSSSTIYVTANGVSAVDVFTFKPEPTPSPTADPALASTGANTASLGVAAAIFVTVGVAIMVAFRRRRS